MHQWQVWRKSVNRYWRYRGNIKLPRESWTHGRRHGRTTRKQIASAGAYRRRRLKKLFTMKYTINYLFVLFPCVCTHHMELNSSQHSFLRISNNVSETSQSTSFSIGIPSASDSTSWFWRFINLLTYLFCTSIANGWLWTSNFKCTTMTLNFDSSPLTKHNLSMTLMTKSKSYWCILKQHFFKIPYDEVRISSIKLTCCIHHYV